MIEREVENRLEQELVNKGWIINSGDPEQNVYRQNPRTKEEKEALLGTFPDFILYESKTKQRPIAIIETKKSNHKTLESALDQGIDYAKKLNAKFVFLYNANRYISYSVTDEKPLFIDGVEVSEVLSLEELQRFTGNRLETSSKIVIRSKADLIDVFKYANDRLREAGVTVGMSRFIEFSNLLFLKLISEKNDENHYGLPNHVLWDSYRNKDGIELLSYINDTVIPRLNKKFTSSDSGDLFTKLSIQEDKALKLKEIVNKLDSVDLSTIDTDIKGDAFEYFIEKYNSTNNDLGEYFTPRHLVKFLVDILKPRFGEKIYDPFCGTGGMLIKSFEYIYEQLEKDELLDEDSLSTLQNKTIWGGEITNNARIAKMNMILTGDGHSNISQHDSFLNPISNKFDIVISNIPFNLSIDEIQAAPYHPYIKNGNAAALSHIIDSLSYSKTTARAAIIVPEQVLGEPSIKELRKEMVEKNILEGVISLPPKVFLPYTESKTSILILRGKNAPNNKKIFFYKVKKDGFTLTTRRRPVYGINDLDEFISIYDELRNSNYVESKNVDYISKDQILSDSNHSLLLFKYKDDEKSGYIKLGKIIERVRKKNLENYPTASITKREFWGMPNGEEFWGENFISVTSEDNSNYSVVSKGNISYNPSRANVGSFGINVGEENLAVTSAYPVFQMISDDYLPEYVYLQITKNNEIINEIINRSSGTVRQSLNKDDFLNIQIPIKSKQEQKLIVEKAYKLYKDFSSAQREVLNFNVN
ncbi:N-6 DNA methylase [Lactococcus petauri]